MYILSKEERYLLECGLAELHVHHEANSYYSNDPEAHKEKMAKIESLMKRITADKARVQITKVK